MIIITKKIQKLIFNLHLLIIKSQRKNELQKYLQIIQKLQKV